VIETYGPAFFLTLFAGLSTGIGAALAFFTKPGNTRFLSIGMGFSAGVMIYISFIEILPKSQSEFIHVFNEPIGQSLGALCFFLGIAISFIIDRLIPDDVNPHEFKSNSEIKVLKAKNASLHRTGIFTALAIAIHNFPEGFATFVSALDSLALGVPIALAIAIHNIPEGMAVSLPIYHATKKRKVAFWYAFASGLAEPAGALLGYFLFAPLLGELTLGITFGIVAGIMIYISFDELLPSARVYGNAHTTILGIVLGMAIMAFSLIAFTLI
jgi:ZIP family zinc transporter